jgi:hypothetical protein
MNEKPVKWQAVHITLSNGTIAKFIGLAAVTPEDNLMVTKIQFTVPADMPTGLGFEKISTLMPKK